MTFGARPMNAPELTRITVRRRPTIITKMSTGATASTARADPERPPPEQTAGLASSLRAFISVAITTMLSGMKIK